MSNNKDKDLDDLFKKGLADPGEEHQAGYREADWGAFKGLIDGPKKTRPMILWLSVLSSVAALLILFFGWWMIEKKSSNNLKVIAKTETKKDTGISGGAKRQQGDKKNNPSGLFLEANSNKERVADNNIQPQQKIFADGSRRADTGLANYKSTGTGHIPVPAIKNLLNPEQTGRDTFDRLTAIKQTTKIIIVSEEPRELPVVTFTSPVEDEKSTIPGSKINIKQQNSFRPLYAISIFGAPDLNGVGSSFTQGKVGSNVGLLFAIGISKRLTISTGALYSVKPYATNFSNYHTSYQFRSNPINVMADCRMIDVPLNISYQVYRHQQSKISIGTGLSSYLMLHENYNYTYADATTVGPKSYKVESPNKYFFGVMNLNATYERQLSSKVGVTLQPYIKLPLTNIGYSQVKLQTTGIAIGLTWNLNSLTKP